MELINITPIVNAVIGLIAAVISVFIVPKVNAYLKEKLSTTELERLEKAVEIAVQAAEQIYKTIPQSGASKKIYVLEYLQKQGYTVNTEEIDTLVEAKVNLLFGGGKHEN